MPPDRLLHRAIAAFLAFPGVVAFAVPLGMVRPWEGPTALAVEGLAVLALGCVALAWCVRDFYVAGRGTLAPWAPPQRLVVVGLYRYSRNPMYVAVLLIVVGWALLFRSMALGVYGAALAIAFHLRVRLGEEPWLARRHGAEWATYAASVPRWMGRIGRPVSSRSDSGAPS